MGNTCAALHIIRTGLTEEAILTAIPKAYGKIGYEKLKKGKTDGEKQVVVLSLENGNALTLLDSTNASMDSGELKELAVLLSKSLKSTAVVTSVYDSDSFEFLVYSCGKQVDAVVSNPDSHEGGLKTVSVKARQEKWSEWFRLHPLTMETFRDPAGMAAWTAEKEAFGKRLNETLARQSVFAEDILCALCGLVGMDAEAALEEWSDVLQRGPSAPVLHFGRKTPLERVLPDSGVSLASYLSADDCPYHLLYPGSWPTVPGAVHNLQWLVVSKGAGFEGVTVECVLTGAKTVRLKELKLEASPFYNGQITSLNKLAQASWTPGPDAKEAHVAVMELFKLPDIDPQSKKQALLQLILVLEVPPVEASGEYPQEEVAIELTLKPHSESTSAMALPPLKLKVCKPTWLPLVSGLNPDFPLQTFANQNDQEKMLEYEQQRRIREVLLLNHDAVWSGVGILPEGSQASLEAARALGESFVSLLKPLAGTMVHVHTQKHMTEACYVGKAHKEFTPEQLLKDKYWQKLFEAESNFQTVRVTVVPPGYAHPIAGFSFQQTLKAMHQERTYQRTQLFDRLKEMNPEQCLEAAGEGLTPTLHVSGWMIQDSEAERLLGASFDGVKALFSQWFDQQELLQGWMAQTATIPDFDLYDAFQQSLYEDACLYPWFYSGLKGLLMYREWCEHKLRFVTPDLWLGEALMKRLESLDLKEPLARIVTLEPSRGSKRLRLKPGVTMAQLERVLLPLLPVEAKRYSLVSPS